jgi:hypothetical protein
MMPSVGRDIDSIQKILGDTSTIGTDGLLWSRAELLGYYCDGYRQLLTLSQAVRRWVVVEVYDDSPNRFALPKDHERVAAIYFDHRRLQVAEVRELDYADSSWPTLSGFPLAWTTGLGPTLTFEVYMIPPAAGDTYSHVGSTFEVSVTDPYLQVGTTPYGLARRFSGTRTYVPAPAPGLGIPRVITSPEHQYVPAGGALGIPRRYSTTEMLVETSGRSTGLARRFSGQRTYVPSPAPGLGIARNISSPDRQYLATVGTLGFPRRYKSSRGNLLVLEVVGPGLEDLHEEDSVRLIPTPMTKYLRYYALARAWEKQGEGSNEALAALCQQRFDRGVDIMRHVAWLSRKDETFQRLPVDAARGRRQPTAQFPPSYQRTWR